MRLTDLGIRALPFAEAGQRDYTDDAMRGFNVRVGKRTKTFMVIVRTGTSRQRIKVGAWPDMLLSKARERARDILAEARITKTAAQRTTVSNAFGLYTATHLADVRASTAEQQARLVQKYLVKPLGKHNLTDLAPHDIAPLIDAIPRKTEHFNAFVALSIFLNWCVKRSYLDASPIGRLEKPRRPGPRDRVLTRDELVAIWRALPDDQFGAITKILILTAQRPAQVIGLTTRNIKETTIEWSAEEMKGGREHIIPLTPMVASILAPHRNSALLFPNRRGEPFSKLYKRRLHFRSAVEEWTHRDFRRAWATISAEELRTEPHVIEAVLAHAVGTPIARVYNRARYLEPMRKALLAFEGWLDKQLLKQIPDAGPSTPTSMRA
jgi:integrase